MRRSRESGLTLMEVMIATMAFMVVLGSIFGALATGSQTVQTTAVPNQLERKAERVVRKIGRAVMLAGSVTLLPNPQPPVGSSTLSFQSSQGWENGAMIWGPVTSIGLEDDPMDPVDGIDNDGDGFVDEGVVVWTRDVGGPDEIREVWVEDVRRMMQGEIENEDDDNENGLIDEAGLSFVLEGSTLVIRLCLEQRGLDRRTVTRTATHAVRLRN